MTNPHHSPAAALRSLSAFMQSDPGLAWSWHCNVAMAAQDAGAPHKEANERAADFMRRAFNVDTSKPPYQSPAEQVPDNFGRGDRWEDPRDTFGGSTDCEESPAEQEGNPLAARLPLDTGTAAESQHSTDGEAAPARSGGPSAVEDIASFSRISSDGGTRVVDYEAARSIAEQCDRLRAENERLAKAYVAERNALLEWKERAERAEADSEKLRAMVAPAVAHADKADVPGHEKLRDTAINARYWLENGRAEPKRGEAVMAVEQAMNAWQNAAYRLAGELAKAEAALRGGVVVPEEPSVSILLAMSKWFTGDTHAIKRRHCYAELLAAAKEGKS